MTDRLKPVPYATHCRCGHGMPKGATARYDKAERLYYDCSLCRPRPAALNPAAFDPNNFCPTGGRFGCRCHLCLPMRPASSRCESGGKPGCTCDICF